MGHVWSWLESKRPVFSEYEKSSCCQSLQDSPDSSLDSDLELDHWKETEEMTEEEIEESSGQEEDSQLEINDALSWECSATKEDEEETGRYKQDVLKYLSEVTHLMEPLSIGGPCLAQSPQELSSKGEQIRRGAVDLKGDMEEDHKVEDGEEENQLYVLKKCINKRAISQGRGRLEGCMASEGLPVINWEAGEELQDLCEDPGESQIQNKQPGEDLEKKMCSLGERAKEKGEDEGCSSELMNQTSLGWRTLKDEFPQSTDEMAAEYSGEHAEDWKDSDLNPSYSNEDSSPYGTPLMSLSSPSTSPTTFWPLMQLSQDDPNQQHSLFKRTLLSIWKMVAGHRYSGPFLKPVSEKQAPGYRDVVKRPTDLSSIKRSLSKGQIQNMVEFQRDLMLMFQNAIMYNSSNHYIHRIALEMQREVLEQLQMLGEALLCSEEMRDFVRRC